jgi:hypothetical protein
MQKKIKGADVRVGMKIKTGGRICLVREIDEESDDLGARLADVELTSGDFRLTHLFDDSEYELRRDAPRPRLVKVRSDDLLTVLEHCSTHDGTAAREAVKRVRQALTG